MDGTFILILFQFSKKNISSKRSYSLITENRTTHSRKKLKEKKKSFELFGCVLSLFFFSNFISDCTKSRRNRNYRIRSTPYSGRLITDLTAPHNTFANGLDFALFYFSACLSRSLVPIRKAVVIVDVCARCMAYT